ncbi:hypothetical protein YC2023_110396 [Brassica napus]
MSLAARGLGFRVLSKDKEVVGSAVGSSLSFLFSINISFSDSEWAWDTHDRVATRDAWIYQNKEIQKLGREKCLTNASMEALLLHILTLATGGIYRVLHARIGITPTLLWLVQPGCSRCLLKKAEMLDTRAHYSIANSVLVFGIIESVKKQMLLENTEVLGLFLQGVVAAKISAQLLPCYFSILNFMMLFSYPMVMVMAESEWRGGGVVMAWQDGCMT